MDKELDLVKLAAGGDYGSEFEYDSEADRAKARRQDLAAKAKPTGHQVASSQEVTQEYDREEGRRMRYQILSLDAFSRHKKFINDYLLYFCGSRTDFKRDISRDKTDLDVIRENHRFLWSDEDKPEESWEKCISKKYYDKLYKEYCITDLNRYKENKIAMRWRVEKEVVLGKGQFECGNKQCSETDGLRTWEVNFGYVEHGIKKNALVKLRLCPECSYKLNYHHKKREVTRSKKRQQFLEKSGKRQKTGSTETSSEAEREGRESPNHQTDDKSHDPKSHDPKSDDPKSHDPKSHDPKSHDQATEDQSSQDSDNPWSGPVKFTEEKTREEEFEDYFEDMFL